MPLDPLDAETVIRLLDLEPLPPEGGYFRSTYRAPVVGLERPLSTAIYYLVTPEQFSALHRLPHDELFHFYRGDEVEQFLIHPDGRGETRRLGPAIERGAQPQVVVPGGAWQGTRLVAGGRWALLGCTMAPGFDYADYHHGDRADLMAQYPHHRAAIEHFTREK